MLVSEIGSLSLEFTRLSQLTGEPRYYDAIARIVNVLTDAQKSTKLPGMWPVSIDAQTPGFAEDNFFTLGGMSDSLYEYFPKHYPLLGGLLSQPKQLYEGFIEVAKKHLFVKNYNEMNLDILISISAFSTAEKPISYLEDNISLALQAVWLVWPQKSSAARRISRQQKS